jgi:transcription antitermination factor NusG
MTQDTNDKGEAKMLQAGEAGNMATVRDALAGITGVAVPPAEVGPDRYLVMVRMGRELDAVDSFRRNQIRCYWPSYEELVTTPRRTPAGQPIRRLRRVGILPGYVFSAVDPTVDFTSLLDRIVGAFDVVRTLNGNPLHILDADIRIIQKIEVGLNQPAKGGAVASDFKVGEKVTFIDDVVGRWPPGKVIKVARDGRISVSVDMMGRKVTIKVLPHQIERM